MKQSIKTMIIVLVGAIFIIAVGWQAHAVVPGEGTVKHVRSQFRKYAPVRIAANAWLISKKDTAVVGELIKAADLMDEIFLRQVWEDNPKILDELERRDERGTHMLLKYFDLNAGPFDRLDKHRAFLDIDVKEQPSTAGFYPKDLKKSEWNSWLRSHPGDRENFEGSYTAIRRVKGKLKAIPYSKEYAHWLRPAASHLRKAAQLAQNSSLKKYLRSRAKAFETNDYFQSDMDWMDLNGHTIEVVIGPYEVYEDRFMGYKAAFEAYISMVDRKETAKLAKLKSMMDEFEENLPIDEEYKNSKRGKLSPIVVAQLIYSGGDAKAGIQTLAFNLPNDERVREAKGSKKVLLKNVSQAKFNEILMPIAKLTLSARDANGVAFDAFFNHTLLHEISHGIGPGTITVKGEETTVNKELKDLYSVIEEAKADTLGLYNNLYLMDKGMYPKGYDRTLFATYLAGLFRSMRFGIGEAHGGANAIQFNYLYKKGGLEFDSKKKKFSVNPSKMRKAIEELAKELLMIEATGSYSKAKKFVKNYRKEPKQLSKVLAKLQVVPVDIRPIYRLKPFQKQ
jgi:hypothetical protein